MNSAGFYLIVVLLYNGLKQIKLIKEFVVLTQLTVDNIAKIINYLYNLLSILNECMVLNSRWFKIKQTSNLPIVPLSRNNLINGCKHLEAFMICRKYPKLQHVPKVFPLEALLVTQPPNVVSPKGNASAQAAILDFLFSVDGALARAL